MFYYPSNRIFLKIINRITETKRRQDISYPIGTLLYLCSTLLLLSAICYCRCESVTNVADLFSAITKKKKRQAWSLR